MIDSVPAALVFVRRHGVVGMTAGAFPSLIEAIAGGPVKGSWWGHARGKRIYHIASAVEDSGDVVPLRLHGKVALVHRALWPELLRVTTDATWRRRRTAELSAAARTLLTRVQRGGLVPVPPGAKAARLAIEEANLAVSRSVHTDAGRHEIRLSSWKSFAAEAGAKPAAGGFDDAARRLLEAGIVL